MRVIYSNILTVRMSIPFKTGKPLRRKPVP